MKKQSEVHPEVKRTAGTPGKRRRRTTSPRSRKGTTWGGNWKVLLLLGTLWTGSLDFRLDMELLGAHRAFMALVLGLSMEGRQQAQPGPVR